MPRVFVCWVTWLAVTSWAGFTLAQLERFSAVGAVAAGAVAAACVALLLPAPSRGARGAPVALAGLALALCTTLLPPIDTTLLSQDASIHRAAGLWLAREGTLAVPDPSLEPLDPQERLVLFSGGSHSDRRLSLVRIPGGVVIPDFSETKAYPSFSHLLSVWVAIASSLGGDRGPAALGVLFAFSAWWAIGLLAWRVGGGWAAVGALGLLSTWLPEHWFGRFLMPEILTQALVWSGVAVGRFAMEAYGLDARGEPRGREPSRESRRGGWVAGAVTGLCLGTASFARLEQFWVFVPALILVRVFARPARWILPPGALGPFLLTSLQGLLHLWWIPTDYGNRIYKAVSGGYRAFVLVLIEICRRDGYLVGFLLNRVLPVVLLAVLAGLLWWGRRLERRTPGSQWRPLLAVLVAAWIVALYSRGLPEIFPVAQAMWWYIPWSAWGAVLLGLPALLSFPGLELSLALVALDQVVWGRVSPEQIWAARRLVTVALPVLALLAVHGGLGHLGARGGRVRAYAARALVAVGILSGAVSLWPVLGVPFQAGGHEFVAEFAQEVPESSTVLLVRPLDWLQLGAALWLGEGRRSMVMREPGYPGYDAGLEDYLTRQLDAPLFVVAGAVVGADGGDHEVRGELARLPKSLRLERLSSHQWRATFLESTRDRPPRHTIERRAVLHLYRALPVGGPLALVPEAQAHLPRGDHRTGDLGTGDLGRAGTPLREDDGHLDSPQPGMHDAVLEVDEEGVAAGSDRGEADRLERAPGQTLEATGAIVERQSGDEAGVLVGDRAHDQPR